MGARKKLVAVLTITLVLISTTASWADPITVLFTLFPDPADTRSLNSSSGSFTYESSLVPAGGGLVVDDTGNLASGISFRWGSTNWTDANAGVFALKFGHIGQLLHFRMGGAPNDIRGLVINPVTDIVDDFFIGSPLFSYTLLGTPEERFFIGTVTSPSIVPEPGTLLLMGSGIAYLVRRRLKTGRTVRQHT
jgi:hypothetical protein